MKKTQFWETKY